MRNSTTQSSQNATGASIPSASSGQGFSRTNLDRVAGLYVADGTVVFEPVDAQGNHLTIMQFIDQHPEMRSPLGGHQGDEGQMALPSIQFDYAANSFWDKLAEAYSGTHDTLNSVIWYDELGNGKNLNGTLLGRIGAITNMTNVVVATPFALSVLLPPKFGALYLH